MTWRVANRQIPHGNRQPLSARIQKNVEKGTWFNSQEIISLFSSICTAAQTLSDAGLVHRDIKPDNIMFFHGLPVISDISILTDDAHQGTRYGTPGFSAPSWFVETGGKIDMYSIAATLFTALTGQPPDKMGRAAFRWPPKGKDSLSEVEQGEWQRLHRVVLRATHEEASERFLDYKAMGLNLSDQASLHQGLPPNRTERQNVKENSRNPAKRLIIWAIPIIILLVGILFIYQKSTAGKTPEDSWNHILKAYHEKDLTKANEYQTEKGKMVATWLFEQPWIDGKLEPLTVDKITTMKFGYNCHLY